MKVGSDEGPKERGIPTEMISEYSYRRRMRRRNRLDRDHIWITIPIKDLPRTVQPNSILVRQMRSSIFGKKANTVDISLKVTANAVRLVGFVMIRPFSVLIGRRYFLEVYHLI